VILEIRGAEGGEEANLFASDLAQMYRRYAALRGWKLEVIGRTRVRTGGLDEAIYLIKGDDAWFPTPSTRAGVHASSEFGHRSERSRANTSSATTCRYCPRPKRSTSRSIKATSRSTSTAPRVPVPVRQHTTPQLHHPPSHRHRGVDAGREEPDPEPSQGAHRACRSRLLNPRKTRKRASR